MSETTRPVHVLHVLRTLGFGGMERNTLRVVRALHARGIRHSIALISDEEDLLDFGDAAELHRIVPRGFAPKTAVELARSIRRLEPTVIHARNFSIWPEAALARALSGTRAPLVVSYHGSESTEAAPLAQRTMFGMLARETAMIFAVSEGAKSAAASLYGVPSGRIEVIANGVDTERFAPGPRRGNARVIIGHVGRLNAIKNLGALIRSTAVLLRRDLDVELRIAGAGPEAASLLELAQTLGIKERVSFAGRIEDVPRFLRDLDVFALPSALEGQPNALLEAMSCGLPSVATAVGGVPELLDHGRAGVLVPSGEPASLTAALAELVTRPSWRVELGDRARARVLEHFRESAMFDAYEALYRDPRRRPRSKPRPSSYAIVRAGERDEPRLLDLLERYVTTKNAARRHHWLYRANPQGPAATWLALAPGTDEIVGFTSIFTREVVAGGERLIGSVGLDAFVRPDHRRRGIITELHRATRDAMAKREIAHQFMFGPPVVANLKALLEAGSELVGETNYLHLPLTAAGLMSMMPVAAEWPGWLAGAKDPVAWILRKLRAGAPPGWNVRVIEREEVDSKLDDAWQEHAPKSGVMGLRDARYVRWRYFENPMAVQTVVAIEARDRLRGWAVLEHAERGALIVDQLFPVDEGEASCALGALIAYVAGLGSPRVSLFTHAGAATNRIFERHGFFAGRSSSLFQFLCGAREVRSRLIDPSGWFVRAGDLDPESCRWSVVANPKVWTDPNYRGPSIEERAQ